MQEITINNKKYVLKSEIKTDDYFKKEITSLKDKLKNKETEYINNKFKQKFDNLNKKYRTLYMKYKHQSDRMALNRVKYLEIIHKLQSEIINQSINVDEMLKNVEKMAEIEKGI